MSSAAITEPLIDAAAAGEERLRAVIEAEHAFVWRSVRRMGVPQDSVEDAVQQVFMVLVRRAHDVTPGQERSFLFSTLIRIASELRRKPHRLHEVQNDEAQDARPDPSPGPEQNLRLRRDRELLDRLLEALPVEQRTVFVLYELEELTLAAISELLGIAQGTVASRLRTARERVQEAARGLGCAFEIDPSQEGR